MVLKNRNGRTSGYRAIRQEEKKNFALVLNEPDDSVRDALQVLLGGQGWDVRCVQDCDGLKRALEAEDIMVVISESSLPDCRPEEILAYCSDRGMPVIFTGHDLALQAAVDLIRQGALDYLDKPFPQSRLLDLLAGLK